MAGVSNVYDYLIIGGGISGLRALWYLNKTLEDDNGRPFSSRVVLIDKLCSIGGVWSQFANDDSTIQTEIGCYGIDWHADPNTKFKHLYNSNSSNGYYFPDRKNLLSDGRNLVKYSNLENCIKLNCLIRSVKKNQNGKYDVLFENMKTNEMNSIVAANIWLFPGHLHLPRTLEFKGEQQFEGWVFHSYSNLTPVSRYRGQQVVVIGHGAFAIEHARTALLNGAKQVYLLCRRKRLVLPRILSWLVNISSSPTSRDQMETFCSPWYSKIPNYHPTGFSESGDWPVSDFYFLAQYLGRLIVYEYEEDSLSILKRGVSFREKAPPTQITRTITLPCAVIVKCLGFSFSNQCLEIFDDFSTLNGFWVNGDPHRVIFSPPERTSRINTITTSFVPLIDMIVPVLYKISMDFELYQQNHFRMDSLPSLNRKHFHFTTEFFNTLVASLSKHQGLLTHIPMVITKKVQDTLQKTPLKEFYNFLLEDWILMEEKFKTGFINENVPYPIPIHKIIAEKSLRINSTFHPIWNSINSIEWKLWESIDEIPSNLKISRNTYLNRIKTENDILIIIGLYLLRLSYFFGNGSFIFHKYTCVDNKSSEPSIYSLPLNSASFNKCVQSTSLALIKQNELSSEEMNKDENFQIQVVFIHEDKKELNQSNLSSQQNQVVEVGSSSEILSGNSQLFSSIPTSTNCIIKICIKISSDNKYILSQFSPIRNFFDYGCTMHYMSILFIHFMAKLIDFPDKECKNIELHPPQLSFGFPAIWTPSSINHISFPSFSSVSQLFLKQVASTPHQIACKFENVSYTYLQLYGRVKHLSQQLSEKYCILRGSKIPQCVNRGLDMIVGILSIVMIGCVYVPIHPKDPIERIQILMKQINSNVLLTQSNLQLEEKLDNTICVHIDDVNGEFNNHNITIADLENHNKHVFFVNSLPSDPCYIVFTSGSTGQPKAAQLTHQNFIAGLTGYLSTKLYEVGDSVFQSSQCTFDVHLIESIGILLVGGTVITISSNDFFNLNYLTQYIKDQKVTAVNFVPSLASKIVEFVESSKCWNRLSSLRALSCSGEPLPPLLLKTIRSNLSPSTLFFNRYGPAECSFSSSCHLIRPQDVNSVNDTVPIGKIFPNYLGKVILDEQGDILSLPGQSGELIIGGPGVFTGYLHNEELTNKKLLKLNESIYYRTGDLVRINSNGEIEFIGRIDNQIKISGQRLEPGEIESVLIKNNKIKNAVVGKIVEKNGQQLLVAAVMLNEVEENKHNGDSYHQQQIIKKSLALQCQNSLLPYMVPSAFVVMKEFPINNNNKIDRNVLFQQIIINENDMTSTLIRYKEKEPQDFKSLSVDTSLNHFDESKNVNENDNDYCSTPQDEFENEILKAFCTSLDPKKRDFIDMNSNFFSLGGNSLVAMTLITDLQTICSRYFPFSQSKISMEQLIAYSSPRSFCDYILDVCSSVPNLMSPRKSTLTFSTLSFNVKSELSSLINKFLSPTYSKRTTSNNSLLKGKINIILTGATGFLGSSILYYLLNSNPNIHVYCLVKRPADHIETTDVGYLKYCLDQYGVWNHSWEKRIQVFDSDISSERLGLRDEDWQLLSLNASAIIHNGAFVHWIHPYNRLKSCNVHSVGFILQLASKNNIPITFVSTGPAFRKIHSGKSKTSEKEVEIELFQKQWDILSGYEQSKLMAECLINEANSRGMNTYILRPGYILPSPVRRICNLDDALFRFVLGCVELGSAPSLDTDLFLYQASTVDYVASIAVRILQYSLQNLPNMNNSSFRIFHTNQHSNTLSLQLFSHRLNHYGWCQLLQYPKWLNLLESTLNQQNEYLHKEQKQNIFNFSEEVDYPLESLNSLSSLLQYFPTDFNSMEKISTPVLESSNTQLLIMQDKGSLNWNIPTESLIPVENETIDHWLAYLVNCAAIQQAVKNIHSFPSSTATTPSNSKLVRRSSSANAVKERKISLGSPRGNGLIWDVSNGSPTPGSPSTVTPSFSVTSPRFSFGSTNMAILSVNSVNGQNNRFSIPCCDPGTTNEDEDIPTLKGVTIKFHLNETSDTSFPSEVNAYDTGTGDDIVVIYSDIFGYMYGKTPTIADRIAEKGYHVIVPDLFDNKPYVAMTGVEWNESHFYSFVHQFPPETVYLMANSLLQKISQQWKPKTIHIVGICYGAKIAALQSSIPNTKFVPTISSLTIAHPTFVTHQDANTIMNIPVMLILAETDVRFPPEMRNKFIEVLKNRNISTQYKIYNGVVHGFFTRPKKGETTQHNNAREDLIAFLNKFQTKNGVIIN